MTERLLGMSPSERAALPVMHPGRVDVIGGGALVLRTVMEYVGATEVIASEHDILDGIALSLSVSRSAASASGRPARQSACVPWAAATACR